MNDDRIRGAFDRLRADAHQVDTMAALRDLEPQRPGRWNSKLLLGGAAALVVIALVVVGIAVFSGGDDDEGTVAGGDDGTDQTADGGQTDGTDDAGEDGGVSPELTGVTWQLVSGTGPDGELAVLDQWPVTLSFADGQVTGTAACNSYFGDVEISDGAVRVGGLGQTEMGCEPDVMALESAYLGALAAVDHAEVADGQLVLSGPSVELIFAAQEPVPAAELVGTTWLLDTIITGDAASTVAGDAALLTFAEDGTFQGGTGCRDFIGRYVVTSGSLQVTDLAMDGECPDELASQDSHVVSVLEGSVTVEVDGQRLTLTGTGGDGLSYQAGSFSPAPPEGYSLDDVGCFGEVDGDLSLGSFTEVQVIEASEADGCRRTVFVLGEPAGYPDESLFPSEIRPDGVVEIALPEGWQLGFDTEALLNTEHGVGAVAQHRDGTPFLYVAHGPGESRVTYWPGAIVVDTRLVADPADAITGEVVLPGPLPAGIVGLRYEVTGLARPFEAQGGVSLRRAPAEGAEAGSGELVGATWSGFELFGDDYVDSRYAYNTASIDTWGEFAFSIDGLQPGEYELLFEAFAPEESGSPGTYVRFSIVPAPVVLSGDGIQFVRSDTGSIAELTFGADEEQVSAALANVLGEPVVQEIGNECPNGADGALLFENGGLSVDFGDGALLSWFLRPGSGLTTLTGIGLGSTRSELEAAYAVEVFESSLGTEFLAGGLGGLLDGDGPDAIITNLWGGQICAFR